jgi:hypothetical protein
MNQPMAYILGDVATKVIKKDNQGMLCIFDTKEDAEQYLLQYTRTDLVGCAVYGRYLQMTKEPAPCLKK